MKKKILTLCLVLALAATAVIGGTLAYFTETEEQTNEFAVGNVKIDLYEDAKQEDGAGNVIKAEQKDMGKGVDTNPGFKYENIQPGHKMTKVAHVENTGKNDAYVALVIKHEGYLNFNKNVDDYYEAKDGYGAAKMQEITDDVFTGWNLLYDKTQVASPNAQVRYTIDTLPTSTNTGVTVLGVGYAQENTDMSGVPQYHYSGAYFTNGVGQKTLTEGEPDFFTISDAGEHDRVWIVYLKLAPNAVFDMDLTTVCPTYFDNNSTNAFENMVLDIKAFAIQTTGFETEKAAFAEALKPGFGF